MSYEVLRLERTGHVAVITLNRPDMMNATVREFGNQCWNQLERLRKLMDLRYSPCCSLYTQSFGCHRIRQH